MGDEMRSAEELATELAELYGATLHSVTLYGSAARGEYREGLSDLNILVLLADTAPATVRRASAVATRWVERGNPPPLLISERELRRSLDVFPIEYADIRDAHRVLHGPDPFATLEIDPEHLRLQCEHELKSKQIRLRESYLLAAEDPAALGELLVRSFSTFLVLFRTVLRVANLPVPTTPGAVIEATAERVGFPPAPLLRILSARENADPLPLESDDPIVTEYLEAIAAAVAWIDNRANGRSGGTDPSS